MSSRGSDSIGDHSGAMVFGALLGGLAAAVGTVLYTPWSGRELRERLLAPLKSAASSASTNPAVVKATNLAAQGAGKVGPVADSVAAAAQKSAARGSAAVQDAAQHLQQLTGSGDDRPSAVEPEVVVAEVPDGKTSTTL